MFANLYTDINYLFPSLNVYESMCIMCHVDVCVCMFCTSISFNNIRCLVQLFFTRAQPIFKRIKQWRCRQYISLFMNGFSRPYCSSMANCSFLWREVPMYFGVLFGSFYICLHQHFSLERKHFLNGSDPPKKDLLQFGNHLIASNRWLSSHPKRIVYSSSEMISIGQTKSVRLPRKC